MGEKLGLLRGLAGSLRQAQAAIVASDLPQLQRQTAEQDRLCCELQGLGANRPDEPLSLAAAANDRAGEIANELVRVECEVRKLNREYGALLRRARRTVDAFCRVIAASEITYQPPRAATTISNTASGSE